jgi:hypothetical protein
MSQPPASSGSNPGGTPPGDDAPTGKRAPGDAPPDPERAWREGFDAFERAIGRPMEAIMQSEEFADAAAHFLKANAKLQSEMGKGSHAWRDAWGLPAREDVQELRSALDDVRRELRTVNERLAAIEDKLG